MTTRAELYRLVDQLDETDVPEALHYLRWLATEGQLATDAGQDQDLDTTTERAEFINRGRPTSEHDSLWNLVGIGRTSEPTDIRNKKDEYLADAFAPGASDT